jgi:hypothetical protein
VLRDAVIGDEELAAPEAVDEVALRGCDLRGHGYQIRLCREAVGVLILGLAGEREGSECGKSHHTEGAQSPHASQYSCAGTRPVRSMKRELSGVPHRHGAAIYPEEACVVSSFFWE